MAERPSRYSRRVAVVQHAIDKVCPCIPYPSNGGLRSRVRHGWNAERYSASADVNVATAQANPGEVFASETRACWVLVERHFKRRATSVAALPPHNSNQVHREIESQL